MFSSHPEKIRAASSIKEKMFWIHSFLHICEQVLPLLQRLWAHVEDKTYIRARQHMCCPKTWQFKKPKQKQKDGQCIGQPVVICSDVRTLVVPDLLTQASIMSLAISLSLCSRCLANSGSGQWRSMANICSASSFQNKSSEVAEPLLQGMWRGSVTETESSSSNSNTSFG